LRLHDCGSMACGRDECLRPTSRRASGMASTCPICGGPSQLMYGDLYDDRYGYPGHYELRSCDRCRPRPLVTSLSEADISELYRTRYPRAEIDLSRMPKFPDASAPVAWLDGARSAAF